MVPAAIMKSPASVYELVRKCPHLLQVVQSSNPDFHAAASHDDPAVLRKFYLQREMARAAAKLRETELRRRLVENPMDAEAQQELEDTIRQANVDANMELAMEHTPESFARVTMLYVDAAVNGTPVKAFVDSGAQSTIMSKACAERCGIMRLIDTRFAGMAVGVGSAPIIGRVHMTQLKLGSTYFPCTFTVLEKDDIDFLLGLDMLKRHRCVLDLAENVLRLEGANGHEVVPFLAERDTPAGAFGNAPIPPQVAPPSSAAAASAGYSGASTASSPATSAEPNASLDVEAVRRFVEMGFPRVSVEQALRAAGGDADVAASLLFASAN
jgi:DNA damage-inducible protein 1